MNILFKDGIGRKGCKMQAAKSSAVQLDLVLLEKTQLFSSLIGSMTPGLPRCLDLDPYYSPELSSLPPSSLCLSWPSSSASHSACTTATIPKAWHSLREKGTSYHSSNSVYVFLSSCLEMIAQESYKNVEMSTFSVTFP